MIFYFATNDDGKTTVCTTQAEAKAIDKGFQKVDIALDKDSMQSLLQDSFDRIFQLESNTIRMGESLSPGESEALDSRPELSPPTISPVKQSQLDRREIEKLWPDLPIHWKLDMVSQTLDEVYRVWPKPKAPEAAPAPRTEEHEVNIP